MNKKVDHSEWLKKTTHCNSRTFSFSGTSQERRHTSGSTNYVKFWEKIKTLYPNFENVISELWRENVTSELWNVKLTSRVKVYRMNKKVDHSEWTKKTTHCNSRTFSFSGTSQERRHISGSTNYVKFWEKIKTLYPNFENVISELWRENVTSELWNVKLTSRVKV